MVVAYDDVESGEAYLLIFHQAIYIESLGSRHLLNPNQMREAGIQVSDIPLQFTTGRPVTKDNHSIIHETLHIPLSMNGVISFFNVRKPTTAEIQNLVESWRIDMPPENRIWNPNDSDYEADERLLRDCLRVNANIVSIENRRINSICHHVVADVKLLWERHLIVSQLPFPSSQYCFEQYCTPYNTYIRFYLPFVYFI